MRLEKLKEQLRINHQIAAPYHLDTSSESNLGKAEILGQKLVVSPEQLELRHVQVNDFADGSEKCTKLSSSNMQLSMADSDVNRA